MAERKTKSIWDMYKLPYTQEADGINVGRNGKLCMLHSYSNRMYIMIKYITVQYYLMSTKPHIWHSLEKCPA